MNIPLEIDEKEIGKEIANTIIKSWDLQNFIKNTISNQVNKTYDKTLIKFLSEKEKKRPLGVLSPQLSNVDMIIKEEKEEEIKDAEKYFIDYFVSMGEGYACYKTKNMPRQHTEKLYNEFIDKNGRPDLLLIANGLYHFVEVKHNGDGWKVNQIAWALRHKNHHVILCVLITPKRDGKKND